jgi:hypothetical protein
VSGEQRFERWAVIELMGHRRMAGHVSEVTIAGAHFLRIEVPTDPPEEHLHPPSAVYGIHPTTEAEVRRQVAWMNPPALPSSTDDSKFDPDDVDDDGILF